MKINDYFTEVIEISILGSTNLNSKFSVQFRVYVMIFPPWKKGKILRQFVQIVVVVMAAQCFKTGKVNQSSRLFHSGSVRLGSIIAIHIRHRKEL